ncbi:MAG: DNA alkylation repair protein [Lewinellaceae bacterium]|nr:DNA alkylation repair protein [Phaeodactylibacter sp.]MCB9037493.1 DNA alkylation repair protein [Lewinellaceae bacterium]
MTTPVEYLQHVKSVFQAAGDPERAQGQMAYMRNQFEYYGLRAPEWVALSKQIFADKGIPEGEDLQTLARLCMEDEYREINYFALEMVQKVQKKQPEAFIEFFEELITTRSWWDTVDWLSKLVGIHFRRFPHLIAPVTERWMASGNMWLQRVCLIFQLTYKEKTDTELMFRFILELQDSKEFFIQKAAGWALRQYSKTDPEAVKAFIEAHPGLAPLTKREGLKRLK